MNQLHRVGEEVVVICHLGPFGIGAPVLLGLAPEIDIRTKSPVFYRSYVVKKNGGNSTRQVGYGVFSNIWIRKKNSKKDRRLAGRILTYAIYDANHLRAEVLSGLDNGISELRLVDESSRDHKSIVARVA